MWAKEKGFTIVELLIVIIVIAILTAVALVAFNGVQARARDSQRMSDIKNIDKAIKLYIADRGHAPDFNGACSIASSGGEDNGCYVNDTSGWELLETDLAAYLNGRPLPKDPCGAACFGKQVANYQSDGYFVYRYNAPGNLPASHGWPPQTITPSESNYTIVAQNLESRPASFGFGLGSF